MKPFRTCAKGLLHMLRPLRWKVVVSALIGIVDVAASLVFVWVSKRVVDIATGAVDLPLGAGVKLFVSILALQILCRVARRYWEGYTVVHAQNDTRAEVFGKVMRSIWTGQERFHSGDTVNRLEEDIQVTVAFICSNLPDFIITVVQLLAATVFLFMLAPSLAWILVFIMPVAVIGSRLFFKKMRALTNEIRERDSRIQSYMQENLQHRVVVKTLDATEWVLGRLGFLQKDLKDKTLTRLNYGAVSRAFLHLGFSSGYALAFLWGIFGLKDGTVTYGLMVAFLQLVGQVQRPVADITRHIPAFIKALSSEDRLLELLEQPQEEALESIVLDGAPGIRVSGLDFTYEGKSESVLSGLDFDFLPGSMTAITGPTGVGKSTLVKVIMGLLAPDAGKVELYDGSRCCESTAATRCNFMYVPQGNSLMSGTIRQNLYLAKPDATEGEMREALHCAAADFVFDIPEGLDLQCSEIGAGLSEGQAQRISIARALLRPGGILILDEATSALDSATEQEMLKRLSGRYRGNKTILCITHRPAATALADRILEISR